MAHHPLASPPGPACAGGYADRVTSPAAEPFAVVLVGMPGSGKSTVGEILALRTSRPFVDLDEAIEHRSGHTIDHLFRTVGEDGFREVEAVVFADALAGDPAVIIAGGGGIVVSPENRALLGRAGVRTVWLRAGSDTLRQRVGDGGGRPLLAPDPHGGLDRLLAERRRLYADVADLTVDVDHRSPGEIVDLIQSGLESPAVMRVGRER